MEKFKIGKIISNGVKDHQTDIILVIGVILISLLSFAAGYITAKQQEKEPIQFNKYNFQLPPPLTAGSR